MTSPRLPNRKASAWLIPLLIAALAAGCGGGGSGGGTSAQQTSDSNTNSNSLPFNVLSEAGAPQQTGDMAADGINWFNFRRQQMGLAPVARNALVDKAALAHSNYQALNNQITHEEFVGRPGFTGIDVYPNPNDPTKFINNVPVPESSRFEAAGYFLRQGNFAFGEVISATGDKNGFSAAEELITAIYHRFVIMEPKFLEAGAGNATGSSGYTYFTTNFATRVLNQGGLGSGRLVTYPFNGQQNLPTVFYSNQEQPDPVPDRNEVGYPISVHADISSTITVSTFTIRPRGEAPLSTLLLTKNNDKEISLPSVAAIIPLDVLQPQTDYDVRFVGTVDNVAVNRSWSFRTR